ncbi:hypothetical protein WJX73_003910 [Symbiochloris irregularis]|uniref:Putative auto-transporter adhesin head GIN domain-containing protein n=1 Tax=Symbiochloris irregularis TaxID=706552 RepID=A0AAW1P166_9CHLO
MKVIAGVCLLALVGVAASAADKSLPAFTSITSSVSNGVLSLSSKGSLATQEAVKVIVSLPASKLAGVTLQSAAGITVIVSQGFNVASLTATSQGSGQLALTGIKANSLKLVNGGTGTLGFVGTVGAATVQATGTGTTYLAGVTKSIAVTADGTATVLLKPASGNVAITGTAGGISSVSYTQGKCSVSASGLGRACEKAATITPPVVKAYWSCGLQLSGSFTCSTSGGSSTTSSTGGGSSFSSSSSSGGGSSYSSSSSSNGGSTTSSSSGDGGGTTLTTNTGKLSTLSCKASNADLKMKTDSRVSAAG